MWKLKLFYFFAVTVIVISVQVAFSSLSQNVQAAEANNVQINAASTNYFLIGKNNFEDKKIDKGELDQVIGTGKMSAPRDADDSQLTYNEFYMKYNFSPEMVNYNSANYQFNPYNYTRYMERATPALQKPGNVLKQYDLNGKTIDDENGALEYNTTNDAKRFISKVNVPQTPKSFNPNQGAIAIKPLFFSYLYVGDGVEGQNNAFKYNTKILFPDTLDYSEKNKVSDYMLTNKNNFVIPTRYNKERDDITLLMRSKTEVNTNRPNVYLDVKDEKNASVVGKSENSKYFINSKISLHLTPFAYNVLSGDPARAKYQSLDGETGAGQFGIRNGQDIGVNQFNTTMNNALRQVRSSSSEGIVSGVGGSVKLTGFYRNGLEDFAATSTQRFEDNENMTDVKFYMLQNETSPFNRPARAWSPEALADEVDGVKNVLSPEVSKFKLSTTRPTITSLAAPSDEFDPDEDDFKALLGLDSIKIEDTGVTNFADASGKPQAIAVDNANLRVRVKEAGTTEDWSEPKTLAQLKTSMNSYAGKTMDIVYVYSATDAEKENVGLLPDEIEDNTGAYAIPLLKQVKVAELKEITVKYVLEGDENGKPLYEDTTNGKVGEKFVHTAGDVFEKDGVDYELITKSATVEMKYQKERQEAVFVYKKINYSDITVDYVLEGKETETPIFSDMVTAKEGTKFDHEAPAIYTVGGESYKLVTTQSIIDTVYTNKNQEFQFVYKKLGSSDIKVDYIIQGKETDPPFFTDTKNGKEDTKFEHEAPLTYEVEGVIYELVTTPNKIDTLYTDENQEFQFVYKKRIIDEIADKGKIITRYVDEDGVVLYTGEEKEGKIGDVYDTISPALYEKDGVKYERITVPENSTGVYKEGTVQVDYIYRAYGQVTATYKTKDGTVLKEEEKMDGPVNSDYTTTKQENITVAGKKYKLTTVPSNSAGKYTKEAIVVEYVYEQVIDADPKPEKVTGKVIVRYVDENGKVLEKIAPKIAELKAKYTTEAPKTIKINGVEYERVVAKDPKNATGVHTEKDIVVDYVYKKKTAVVVVPEEVKGKVIVRYLDSNGKVLKELDAKTGKVESRYLTLAPKNLSIKDVDYERVVAKDPKNATGSYTKEDIYVDYIYKEKVIEEDEGTNEETNTGTKDPEIEPDVDIDKEKETTETTEKAENGKDGSNGVTTTKTINSSTPATNTPTLSSSSIPTESATNTSTTSDTTDRNTATESAVNEEANAVSKSLPKTGSDSTLDHTLVIIGLLLMAGATVLVGRNRKNSL